MEVTQNNDSQSYIRKTTTSVHKSQVVNSSSNGVMQEMTTHNGNSDKKWQIIGITENGDDISPKSLNSKLEINDVTHVDQYSHSSQKLTTSNEAEKWEIESIHTVDGDRGSTTVQPIHVEPSVIMDDSKILANGSKSLITSGKFAIQSVSVISEPVIGQILDREWDIRSVNTQEEERPASRNDSLFQEISWTEHHTIPIHSSSIELTTGEKPIHTSLYKPEPVTKVHTSYHEMRHPRPVSETNITENRTNYELRLNGDERRPRPVDHYSYQYEDASKTQRLQQLVDSRRNDHRHKNVYSSFTRPSHRSPNLNLHPQTGQWPTTNCMRQSIHVDNDDEEIIGVPLLYDDDGTPISNLHDTQSFNSITENVTFQIHKQSAQMKIEIDVVMYHQSDPRRHIWKRKQVKVTRIVELDLSKVQDKTRLYDIVGTCNERSVRVFRHANDGSSAGSGSIVDMENQLTGKEAFRVFYNLMAITRDEEMDNERRENVYLTRHSSGRVTSVICEPQFLLSGGTGTQSPRLLY